MINLIKNEFTKIFRKKGVYITLLVMFLFVVLVNYIYSSEYTKDGVMKSESYIETNIDDVKNQMDTLDKDSDSYEIDYVELKTELDVDLLINEYGEDSWQSYVISSYLYNIIYSINEDEYLEKKDGYEMSYLNSEYNTAIKNFEEDNWQYYVNKNLDNVNSQIEILENNKKNTTDKKEISEINNQLESLYVEKEVLNYRIENNISYESSYLNNALVEYSSLNTYINDINYDDITEYEKKYEYYQSKSRMELDKYIFENKINNDKPNDTRGILSSIFDEFEIFIVIIISVISGVIIAEEFSKGTIKQLLIKPYTRNKILLSKYITSLLIILFAIVSLVVMELIVGGIFFGYNSLSIPVAVYNFNIEAVQTYNIFVYLLIVVLSKLPIFILVTTLMFLLGVLTTNSAITISIGLVGYMVSPIISNIAYYFDVVFLKYFPTLNWDLSIYLFGMIPLNKNINYNFSLLMCIIYFLLLIIPTFIIFKKKNIKNI